MATDQKIKENGELDVSDARKDFADVVSRVGFGRERIVLCRNGKRVAALLPLKDLERLEQIEKEEDLKLARAAIREGKYLTSREAKKKLGLS
jgi:prevent-host-death family protein